MIRRLMQQFSGGGAAGGRRPARGRRPRRGRASGGGTGARIGSAVERMIRSRR